MPLALQSGSCEDRNTVTDEDGAYVRQPIAVAIVTAAARCNVTYVWHAVAIAIGMRSGRKITNIVDAVSVTIRLTFVGNLIPVAVRTPVKNIADIRSAVSVAIGRRQ